MLNIGYLLPVQGGQFIADDSTWQLTADGIITITAAGAEKEYGNREDVPWYNYMSDIRRAIFEDGISSIGTYVLNDAIELEEVIIPDGVTQIGLRSFSNCSALKEISLPDSLQSIDYWGLSDCDSLEEIVFPAGMKEISNYTLQDCDNLKKIVVQGETRRIGYDAFENCRSLECIYLPESIEIIDAYALNGCYSLKDIYYAGTQSQWESIDQTDNMQVIAGTTVHYGVSYGLGYDSDKNNMRTITLGTVPLHLELDGNEWNVFVKGCLENDAVSLRRSNGNIDILTYCMEKLYDSQLLVCDTSVSFDTEDIDFKTLAMIAFETSDYNNMQEFENDAFGSEYKSSNLIKKELYGVHYLFDDNWTSDVITMADNDAIMERYITILNGIAVNIYVCSDEKERAEDLVDDILFQIGEEYGAMDCFPYTGEEYYSNMFNTCEMTQGIILQRGDTFQQDRHYAFTVSGDGLNNINIIFNDNGEMLEAQTKMSVGFSNGIESVLDTYQLGNNVGASLACMVTTALITENGMTETFVNELMRCEDKINSIAEFVDGIFVDGISTVDNETVFTKEEILDSYGRIVASVEVDENAQSLNVCYQWLPIVSK